MKRHWMHVGFALLASAGTVGLVVQGATGCSSNDAPTSAAAPLSQCPLTLAEANGAACETGLVCPYPFACGSFQQQATCSCASGKVACVTDATDAAVAVGATPACVSYTDAAACPAGEPENLSSCSAIGQVCEYRDLLCPGSEAGANIDTCECQGGTNGGLVYDCVVTECTPSEAGVGTLPEGGGDAEAADASDGGGGDGSSDASQDAGDDSG